MSDSKILTAQEVGEIEARPAYPWVRFGDDPSESPHLPCGVAMTVAERDALCATVRQLLEENERLRKLVRHMQFPRGG